jgi:hypothetical protein
VTADEHPRRRVLADHEIDAAFDRDGYVVLRGFCDPEAVAELRDAYDRLGPAPGDVGAYCHFDFQSRDREYKGATDREIRRVLAEPLARSFVRYRPYYGNYVMKWPSSTSWFGVHQDSCFIDESEAASASIWVATCEVDERNGAVWFFPGSHRMRPTVRGSNQMAYSFQDVGATIEERCGRIVRMAPGDAIVFDHRVVHWSYANTSGEPRLAAVLGVVPEEATLIHHRTSDDGSTVETFAIDDAFFIDNDPFGSLLTGVQGYRSLGRHPFVVEKVTDEELDRWLEAHPVEADVELSAALRRAAHEAAADPVEAAVDTGGRGTPGPAPSIRAEPESSLDPQDPSAGAPLPAHDQGTLDDGPAAAERRTLASRVRSAVDRWRS